MFFSTFLMKKVMLTNSGELVSTTVLPNCRIRFGVGSRESSPPLHSAHTAPTPITSSHVLPAPNTWEEDTGVGTV